MLQKLKQLGYEDFVHFICKKDVSFVTVLVHWDDNFDKDIDTKIKTLFKIETVLDKGIEKDLYKNYICYYSFVPYFSCFTNSTIRYTYVPELLFLKSYDYIDFDNLLKLYIAELILERHFCFLNNRPTAQRKELFYFFQNNNLLKQSYASYLNNSSRGFKKDEIEQPFKNFEEAKIHYDIGPEIGYFYPVTNFLFDVCVETYCTEGYIGLTEKSLKPFLWGHIPLIYGPAGTYRHLESLGFDVFKNLIDTSFDIETNHNLRMKRFQQEIIRLSKIPLTNYSAIQLQQRFINNRKCYIKNVRRSLNALDYIERETQFIINNREMYLGY